MVVRLIKKRSVLPALCVGLAWFGTGCDSSSVNESGSSGAKGSAATAAPAKDAPPPPKTIKDYYEQQQAQQKAPAGKAAPTTKGETTK
jgi:hypothetical protein